MLIRITSERFVAGLTVENGWAVTGAPILSGLVGVPAHEAKEKAESMGWTWERVQSGENVIETAGLAEAAEPENPNKAVYEGPEAQPPPGEPVEAPPAA